MTKTTETMQACVTAVHRERFEVASGHGTLYARLKQSAYHDADTLQYPTVGDLVEMLYNPAGDSLILATCPRRSYFMRKIPGKSVGEQAVAANFDEVFVLTSLNQDFNARRIERYVSLAWQSGGTPVVVLTKVDLATDASAQVHDTYAAAPGADVYVVSAQTGEGLEALRERLTPGKTIVLLGSSGVGKSSLVNALAGQLLMDTGEIREDDARGRHTTTYRQMLSLANGVSIIDTPGMRELGLWDTEEGVKEAFDDITALASGCRFSDCAHKAEPGCAVKKAIAEGALDPERLKSFQKLQREAARRSKIEQIKKR